MNKTQETTRLVLLRHGQSIWNRDRRFAGWGDIPLSPQGEEEAKRAGRLLKQAGFT
ncbi:MAG: phosphoglyceromutase, partial [Nitrosomonas sp.]|nr:phosphoglyceromutase [Nitrosomonas sp.]